MNAMAVRLPSRQFVDPYGGMEDVAHQRIRTPGTPEDSFSDDPLRMMRAARFAAQLGFTPDPAVVTAMTAMADRITIVSAERVRDELEKLICADHPRIGLDLLVSTGLAEHVLPELPALQLMKDEHHRHKDVYEHSLTVLDQAIDLESRLTVPTPDFVVRFAALIHDIGKPKTLKFEGPRKVTFHHHDVVGAKLARKRMKALRFSNEQIEQVSKLIELHLRFHGYGDGEWTDSAVRRYVRDAGDQLDRLHILTRADCTTRNRRKAESLRAAYDDLETRIERLQEQEELDALRPDLDGNQIMQILGLAPGREVGEAYKFLMELRLDQGPLGEDRAREELLRWWSERSSWRRLRHGGTPGQPVPAYDRARELLARYHNEDLPADFPRHTADSLQGLPGHAVRGVADLHRRRVQQPDFPGQRSEWCTSRRAGRATRTPSRRGPHLESGRSNPPAAGRSEPGRNAARSAAPLARRTRRRSFRPTPGAACR